MLVTTVPQIFNFIFFNSNTIKAFFFTTLVEFSQPFYINRDYGSHSKPLPVSDFFGEPGQVHDLNTTAYNRR